MCQVKIADTASPTQFKACTVSVSDVDPLVNGSNQAVWDNDSNTNTPWTLRFEWATSVVPPVNVDTPNEILVRVFDMSGGGAGVQIGSDWAFTIDPTSLSGLVTLDNFQFDTDPLNGLAGAETKVGLLQIWLQVQRTGATPSSRNYLVESDGTNTPPTGGTANWGRGYFRQRLQFSVLTKASNVSAGGATPTTWAYPDSLFLRHNVNRTLFGAPASSSTITTRIRTPAGAAGVYIRSQLLNLSDTLTNIDHTFAQPSGVNEDFPVAVPVIALSYEWELNLSSSAFGNDRIYAWRSTGLASGWSFIDEGTVRRAGIGGSNMDPRLTVDSATRTSSNDIVNFGLHTVAGTFKLKNSRNEFITSAHSAAVRQFNIKSYDISPGAEQSTLAALPDPDGSGVYTIPAIAYVGPTVTTSRGTGPNGDTAAHSLTGRDKGIRAVHPSVIQRSSPSARLWALSDLLRLDVHPQDTAGLVKDTNPLAVPGDAEESQFEIGDELYLFAYVSDVNAVGSSGIQLKVVALKPTGAAHSAEVDRTSASGADLGWVTTSYDVTDISPMGEHYGRVRVDVDFTGASGNYGFADVISDPALDSIGGLRQTLTVIPAPVFDAVANALHGIISFR